MRQILKDLNEETGTLGSIVITPDGILVAAALNASLQEDAMAAFASSLLVSMKHRLAQLRATSCLTCCTLKASNGALMFLDMENAYLVLVADPEGKLDPNVAAVQNAVHRIKNRRIA